MPYGDSIALEVVGPHGWIFRLDPMGVANIWSCGSSWSWVRMTRSGRDPLLVRGNAVVLIAQCDALRAARAERRQAIMASAANTDFRTSNLAEKHERGASLASALTMAELTDAEAMNLMTVTAESMLATLGIELGSGAEADARYDALLATLNKFRLHILAENYFRPAEPLPDGSRPGWPERIASYRRAFPHRESYLTYVGGERPWLYGYWRLGYFARAKAAREADFYGAYPGDYLHRVRAMFPDRHRVLHVCSGMVDLRVVPGDTLDINPARNPTYCVNAETMQGVPLEIYDLVLADPPYSPADAVHYGTEMLVPGRVMKALERLSSGAYVVWLDEREPAGWSKAVFILEGIIGMSTSAGHRCRQISIFRRV